jgi:nucleoside-diphosphate-sugar epimerase
MGPTLARMAARAITELGLPYKVYGVARFSQPATRAALESAGVQTIPCDLLDRAALAQLPDSSNVIFMAGQKFGTTGAQHLTWGTNTYLPALAAERYVKARTVVFSTGNVYGLTPVVEGGAREVDEPNPTGEYANSCLGRERIFEYFSRTQGLRCAIMRLNYAVEMRYGVLVDIANKVFRGEAVDVSMGAANVIWQGDANAQALSLLNHCAAPPFVCNVAGPEMLSIRRVAEQFGERFGVEAHIVGEEAQTAFLSNAARANQLFGYPTVPFQQLFEWVAKWVQQGGEIFDKPTHFSTRDGKF